MLYNYFWAVSESPQQLLLQALNDQKQAAIDESLATEGVKDWINRRALPEHLDNPIRHFKDVQSITCLTFASLVNKACTVQQLVEAGADVTITDSEGFAPLHYACASDVESETKLAYLMQRDESSQTATCGSKQGVLETEVYTRSLRLAAAHNQADRVRALIDDHGASVNATDWRGRTALYLAAEAGHAETVKVLVQHPSFHFGITDWFGDTAADRASRWGHDDIAALIEAKFKGNFRKDYDNFCSQFCLTSVTSFVGVFCSVCVEPDTCGTRGRSSISMLTVRYGKIS